MPRGKSYAHYPFQHLYGMGATADILGWHRSTGFRRRKNGTLITVDTPFGERVTREEIARQKGTTIEQELASLSGKVVEDEPLPASPVTPDLTDRYGSPKPRRATATKQLAE